jgi:putative phage-type endonuclease
MAELIAERLTGEPAERFSNAAMAWGTEKEPDARAAYSFVADVTVEECGFVPHPTIAMSGASPDGLVGADGLVEIKCPNTATHIDTLLALSIPSKYVVQMTWQMVCTGRKWCDFVSFDPRIRPDMQLFIKRVEFDCEYAMELESEVRKFISDLDGKLAALLALFDKEAA